MGKTRKCNIQSEDYAIEERRQRVAQLYVAGKTQFAIALLTGVTQGTISTDLAAIRKAWRESATRDFDERKDEELAKIDDLERLAREAWERSCRDAEFKSRREEKSIRTFTPEKTLNNNTLRNDKGKGFPTVKDAKRTTKDKKGITEIDGEEVGGEAGQATEVTRLVPTKVIEEARSEGQAGDPRFLSQIAWCIEMRIKLMGLLETKVINNTAVQINWNELYKRPDDNHLSITAVDPIQAEIDKVARLEHIKPTTKVPSVIVDDFDETIAEARKLLEE